MLYRTHHHPFLYTFNPSPHFLSSLPLQANGFRSEMASDDLFVVSGDDFFVDQLLDFSNGFDEDEQPHQLQEPDDNVTCSVSTAPENSSLDFGSLPQSQELTLPVGEEEGLESLEWLSHFVEDSFPDYSNLPPKPTEQPCFTTPVQTKARTKRARTGVRVWPVILSPSSSTSSSSSSNSTTSFLKPKRKPADHSSSAAQPRRCSHCGVTKTPQWRAGPLGSKTLCNACGVRFKSGRLLPEYRPACSPTFSTDLHSNNHRKVLEMRRKKEPEMAVPSFC
ncbi:hypothetical protein ACS0TY_030639 [Phlomoides rotata]